MTISQNVDGVVEEVKQEIKKAYSDAQNGILYTREKVTTLKSHPGYRFLEWQGVKADMALLLEVSNLYTAFPPDVAECEEKVKNIVRYCKAYPVFGELGLCVECGHPFNMEVMAYANDLRKTFVKGPNGEVETVIEVFNEGDAFARCKLHGETSIYTLQHLSSLCKMTQDLAFLVQYIPEDEEDA